jgi:hypothetical protein
MNFDRYPWLTNDLSLPEALEAIGTARESFIETGAAIFPEFITQDALKSSRDEAVAKAETAFVTDGVHTAHQLPLDPEFAPHSVRNHQMRTQVASIAYDELSDASELRKLYNNEKLRDLVAAVVNKPILHLSEDPLGACSINVFRPNMHHSFHFDESEFSTTLMLQCDAHDNHKQDTGSGLFQYTHPLRSSPDDLALHDVAATLKAYDKINPVHNDDDETSSYFLEDDGRAPPQLHTLDFAPGTLSIFSGSKSLHRVTRVVGPQSRLVAVLTFASEPGFCNSPEVQHMFWGRSSVPPKTIE